MSSLIPSRLRAGVLRIAALTCGGVVASTGVALASCPARSLSTPFTQWADDKSYFLVPGGSFEGTPDQVDWTLSGASLTPERAYRSAVSHETACHELRRCAGTQFDPAVVDALLWVLEDGGDERKLDTAQTAAAHVRSLLAAA